MLWINTNGNDIPPNIADIAIANNNANTPMKKPSIANNIFIAISHANPSKSQLNISPGNLMDNPAHQTNTSPI